MNKHNYSKSGWLKHVMSSMLSVLVVALAVVATGCAQKEAPPEPPIPTHYTTYTDEAGLFSISYPPDWEPLLSEIERFEQTTKELIKSIEADLPLERTSMIFLAGVPTEMGWDPNVNIYAEPASSWTLDKAVDEGIRVTKDIFQEYHEFSRIKTTVGGREAVIVDAETYHHAIGRSRGPQMSMIVGKVYCYVTCATSSEKFSDYEDDFYHIFRSLRILK